jgi:hypothetical protein
MPTAIALRSSSNVALAGAQLIASRRSPRTRDAYSRDLDAWVVFCADRGFDPDQALLPHAVLYRDVLEKTCAPATVGRRLSSLSLIYGALQASGVVPRNPFDGKLLPRPEISRTHSGPPRAETTETGSTPVLVPHQRPGHRGRPVPGKTPEKNPDPPSIHPVPKSAGRLPP